MAIIGLLLSGYNSCDKLKKTIRMEKNQKSSTTDPKKETKGQTQSKYDSHSEEMPHQKEIINDNANPDRVSHSNTDGYLDKLASDIDNESNIEDEGLNTSKSKTNKREWDASFYPKKNA